MHSQSRSLRIPLAALLMAAGFMAGQHAQANTLVMQTDTLVTLDNVQDVNGGTYTGSFDFNSITDAITGVSISVADSSLPDNPLTFSGSPSDSYCAACSPTGQPEFALYTTPMGSSELYSLYLDIASPLNLDGPNALLPDPSGSDYYADLDYGAPDSGGTTVGIVQGSLDTSTVGTVPEPSTFALFGAALLGLVAFGGRRWRTQGKRA